MAQKKHELFLKEKKVEEDLRKLDSNDRMLRKSYEDYAHGILSEREFRVISKGYESEQEALQEEVDRLTKELEKGSVEVDNVAKLIAVTKRYTRIDKLTPEILNAFIDKIAVHERVKQYGRRMQEIEIYYSFVGIVKIPTQEELDEMRKAYKETA